MTKLPYSRLETTGDNAVDATRLRVSSSDLRTIEQALIDAGSSGGGGADLGVEFRTITALENTNKELTLTDTPGAYNKVVVFVVEGSTQYFGIDYTVTGDVVSWDTLGMDGLVEEGTRLVIIYPKSPSVPSPGGSGEITKVELFETDGVSTVGGNKYVDLNLTPTDSASVRAFIIGGSAQINDELDTGNGDFEIIDNNLSSPKRFSWNGLGMDNNLSGIGTKFIVVYTINTTTAAEAINVQLDDTAFNSPVLATQTDVQSAFNSVDNWIDNLSLGSSILHSNVILVAPSHPSAADDTDLTTPFITIQKAIEEAPLVNNVILISPGSYNESLNLTVAKNIHLKGMSGSARLASSDNLVRIGGQAQISSVNGHTIQHFFENIFFDSLSTLTGDTFSVSVDSLNPFEVNVHFKDCVIQKSLSGILPLYALSVTGYQDVPVRVFLEDTIVRNGMYPALAVNIPVDVNNLNSLLSLKRSTVEGEISINSRSRVIVEDSALGAGTLDCEDYKGYFTRVKFDSSGPLILGGTIDFSNCYFKTPCQTTGSEVRFSKCEFDVDLVNGNYLQGSGDVTLSSCSILGTSRAIDGSVNRRIFSDLQTKSIILSAAGATPASVSGSSAPAVSTKSDHELIVVNFQNGQRAFWSGIRFPRDFNSPSLRFKVFADVNGVAGSPFVFTLRAYIMEAGSIDVVAPFSSATVTLSPTANPDNRASAFSSYFNPTRNVGSFNSLQDYELYVDLTLTDSDGGRSVDLRSVLLEFYSDGISD